MSSSLSERRYECTINIKDLIKLEDVMVEHSLGPNGGINFLMTVEFCRSFHVESSYMLDVILY